MIIMQSYFITIKNTTKKNNIFQLWICIIILIKKNIMLKFCSFLNYKNLKKKWNSPQFFIISFNRKVYSDDHKALLAFIETIES